MKVNKYFEPGLAENYIDIHYDEIDSETQRVLRFLDVKNTLVGRNEEATKLLYPQDILYCEIVERRCYAYLMEEVWQLDISLQEMLDRYGAIGFARISKSMVVNIYKIDCFKPDINMRVKLILENGEKIILNRAYKSELLTFIENIRKEGNPDAANS